jgi:hypothetical protein
MTQTPNDLRPIDFSKLTWDDNDPAGSLERVAEAVSAEAEHAIDWYLKKKTHRSEARAGYGSSPSS